MRKEKSSSNFGVLIILIGIGVLLYNLDILKITMFWGIVKLWPLLLIVAGLSIIFKRVRYLSVVLWLLFIGVVIGYSYIYIDEMSWSFGPDIPSISYASDAVGIEEAFMNLDLSTGSVIVKSQPDTTLMYSIPEKGIDVAEFTQTGTFGELEIKADNKSSLNVFQSKNFEVVLPEGSDWSFEIDGGVLALEMDLTSLKTTGGNIDLGIGALELIFGDEATGYYEIDLGVGDILITIPDKIGVKLIKDSGVASIDTPNYTKNDGIYYSKNYEDAENKIEINLDIGVGNFEIK